MKRNEARLMLEEYLLEKTKCNPGFLKLPIKDEIVIETHNNGVEVYTFLGLFCIAYGFPVSLTLLPDLTA